MHAAAALTDRHVTRAVKSNRYRRRPTRRGHGPSPGTACVPGWPPLPKPLAWPNPSSPASSNAPARPLPGMRGTPSTPPPTTPSTPGPARWTSVASRPPPQRTRNTTGENSPTWRGAFLSGGLRGRFVAQSFRSCGADSRQALLTEDGGHRGGQTTAPPRQPDYRISWTTTARACVMDARPSLCL